MTRAEFQAQYGPHWAAFTAHPSFFAAMQLASAAKLKQLSELTDEQIKDRGDVILAGFRDRLQMENFLIELAVTAEEPAFDLPPETYRDSTDGPVAPEPEGGNGFIQFNAPPVSPRAPRKKKPARKSK